MEKNIKNLSYNENEILDFIIKIGSYSSTRHNEKTKSLENLIKKGFPIVRTIENKFIMKFTYNNNQ